MKPARSGGSSVQHYARPLSEVWSWQPHARCRGLPPDIFFPAEYAKGAQRVALEQVAKKVCQACPVRRRCLAYALNTHQQYGIWGATTPRERRLLISDDSSPLPASSMAANVTPAAR
jgi:hypothetical protein